MNDLLIDIGNSRLKWASSTQGELTAGQALDNKSLNYDRLIDAWQQLRVPNRLAISCVSANYFVDLVRAAAGSLWPNISIIEAKSQAQTFGVRNAYREPEKLGVDRWLALLAVQARYPLPACVVDCGTAITVDLLDDRGNHLGGMICPGLKLMKKSLCEGTEALGYHDSEFVVGPSDHTEAAIYSGVLSAAAGLIEHVYSKQSEGCQLILTGGDAPLIGKQLGYGNLIDADLVLRGLSRLLE